MIFPIFILGLIIGSFLNVVILRHNTGQSLAGRSGCMSCSESLQWWELLPVVSFFVLRGKCANCGSAISWQYPIVEILTAFLFVMVFLQGLSLLVMAVSLVIVCLLVLISAYDLMHTIIPNQYVYVFILLTFSLQIIAVLDSEFINYFDILNSLFAAFLFSVPVALLWYFSRGEWIGLGDAKLIFGIALVTGVWGTLVMLTVASVVASILSILYSWYKRYSLGKEFFDSDAKQGILGGVEIPFAPFLIFGFVSVWLLHFDTIYLNVIGL